MMGGVTFHIRETTDHDGKPIYEVWRRHHETECLLAEANTRVEAREIMSIYVESEPRRFADPATGEKR